MSAAAKKKDMTSSQRSGLMAAGLFILALLIYWFGVNSTQDALRKARIEDANLEVKKNTVQQDIRESRQAGKQRLELEKDLKPYLSGLLEPVLGSWPMSAKAVLDPLAADVGLQISDYTELPQRALPLPKPMPLPLYARQPIRVSCRGTYGEIASFVMRVEKMLPYVSLQALSIKSQKDPSVQLASLVFEWPVTNELSRTVAVPAKGGAK